MKQIPLSLVTGFLGSGKTTFLRQVAQTHMAQKVVYLVNEFSPVDVDGTLLQNIGQNMVSVPGGSIFCKCLARDFIKHLTNIPEQFHTQSAPLTGVVVEASGIANPMVVSDMLRETGLDQVYSLTSVVSIVDPGSFRKLIVTLPNIRAQVQAASTVLLNKVDLFNEEDIDATEEMVCKIQPMVNIVRTEKCQATVDLFSQSITHNVHGEYAKCVDPNYAKLFAQFPQVVDVEKVRTSLNVIGDELYRAKGFVSTDTGMCYVDVSASGITIRPSTQTDVLSGLAMICRGEHHPRTRAFLEQAKSGALTA